MGLRRADALAAVPAIGVFLLHCRGHGAVFVDDAYVFYRYAANWAAGLGLVYNPGEHVEGFSSLLWTMMLALGARWSVDPETLAPVLGIALGIVCLGLLAHLTPDQGDESRSLKVAVPIAGALSTGLVHYAKSGMDTLLFAAVLLATVGAARYSLRAGGIAALALGLATLVVARAEGFLYSMALLGVVGIAVRGRSDLTRLTPGRYGVVVATTLTAVAAQFAGRFAIYREWLPAPVSAKAYMSHALAAIAGSGPGEVAPFVHALIEGIRYELFLLPVVAIPFLALGIQVVRGREVHVFAWLLAIPIALNAAITVGASGDWMDYHRHIVPVWPIALLFLAWGLQQACGTVRRWLSPRAASIVVALAALSAGVHALEAPANLLTVADGAREGGRSLFKGQIGAALNRFDRPVTLVTNVVGKLPYRAGPKTYVRDLLGLTDVHNSKHGDVWSPTYGRTDYEYSFGRPFDLLVTNSYTDLEYLLAHWKAHPGSGKAQALYASPEWTANCLFVVVDTSHPVSASIQALCECLPGVLDEGFLRFVRSLPLCSGAAA